MKLSQLEDSVSSLTVKCPTSFFIVFADVFSVKHYFFVVFYMHREVKSLSHVQLIATPWTVACTRLLHPWDFLGKSTGAGCHFLLQGILPDPGIKPRSPASEPPGKRIAGKRNQNTKETKMHCSLHLFLGLMQQRQPLLCGSDKMCLPILSEFIMIKTHLTLCYKI